MIVGKKQKYKYFMVSDLHGVNPSVLLQTLNKSDFDKTKHTLVVAGDITHGFDYDNQLVSLLQTYPKSILLRGNHDFGPFPEIYQNGREHLIDKDTQKIVGNLPYQYEADDFIVAHGLFLTKPLLDAFPDPKTRELISLWCSPILLDLDTSWQNIPKEIEVKIREIYSSSRKYVRDLEKPLFVGHYSEQKTNGLAQHIKIKNGFMVQHKKITYLDCGLMYKSKEDIPTLRGIRWN